MNKINIAKNSLKENKYTCVLFNGKKQIVSFKTGIKPLLYLTQKGTNLSGYVLADKIVGKAVALLALNLGIIEVFAETLSVSAKEILIKHNIAVSYETLTEKIINRQGTDICPMEKTVLNTFDLKKAFILLKNKVNELKSKGENVMKSLVVYYSRAGENYFGNSLKNLEVGNTKVIAEKLAKLTNSDIFEVKQVNEYSSSYNKCIEEAKRDQENDARPDLESYLDDIDEYDTIYVCYPNFWGTMPMAMFTFLEEYDFDGKTIKPLCTHEGSGMGHSESDIKKLCPNANVKKGLAIRGSNRDNCDNELKNWID